MLVYLQTNWVQILDRWGWPTLVAIVLAIVFWKGIWPQFKKQLEDADAQRKAAQSILTEQLQKAEKRIEKADQRQEKADERHETLVKRVTEAFEEQTRINTRQADALEEILERTKHLN